MIGVILISLLNLLKFFWFNHQYIYYHQHCYYHHPISPPMCFPFEAQREILLSQCKSQTNLSDLFPLNHRYCFNKESFAFFGKMIFNFNKCVFLHTKILSHLILQKLSEVVEQKIRSGGKPSK